ncbi:hypothetical protein D3C77_814020 [compost metagenome]
MGNLELFVGRDGIAVLGIDCWCKLPGLTEVGLFRLDPFNLGNFSNTKPATIKRDRSLQPLATG